MGAEVQGVEKTGESINLRLVLHIGRPKTGTTSLQKFLYSNREVLSKAGFLLFDRIGAPNNIDIPAYFATQSTLSLIQWSARRGLANKQQKDEYFLRTGLIENLDDQIAKGSQAHHTAIITSEQLATTLTSSEEIKTVAQFMFERFDSIKVVCFVRPQIEQIPSGWSTTVRGGGTGSLAKFISTRVKSNSLDYAELAGRWSQHFGSGNLHFSRYRSEADWDIRKRFVELHLDNTPGLQFPTGRSNPSYSWLEAQLVRLINIAVPLWPPGAREPNARNVALRTWASRLCAGSGRPISLSARQTQYVRDTFRESNLAFSRAHLPEGEALE